MTTENRDLYPHLNRMQKRVMAKDSYVTRKQFEAEPKEEQERYYQWMCRQCGELCDLI